MHERTTVSIVGLNPSWQKTLRFESFRYGDVNRALELQESAAGKGANAARAIRTVDGACILFEFVGGMTGQLMRRALDREGIPHVSVETGGRTRVCTTILNDADGSMTELIEPASPVSPAAQEQLLASFEKHLAQTGVMALCGTYPPGLPPDFPAAFARSAAALDVPVVLDGVRGVLPVLEAGVDVLKINCEEVLALTGRTEMAAAVRFALSQWRLRAVVVTNGPAPAVVGFADGDLLEIEIPKVGPVRNPLGAGDCVTGLLAWKMCEAGVRRNTLAGDAAEKSRFMEWIRKALACAAASCLTPLPAVFDPRAAEALHRNTTIRRV